MEIPPSIGVYIIDNHDYACYKKRAKRQPVSDPVSLLGYMVRSLNRDVSKARKNDDELYMEALNRQCSQAEREAKMYREKYWALVHMVQRRYGLRWKRRGESELPPEPGDEI